MTEGLVGLGHLVGLFFAAHRAAGVVHRVHELAGEPLGHRLARTLAGGLDDPAHGERRASIRADLDGDLVGRAADAPGLHFDQGHRVLERGVERAADDVVLDRRQVGDATTAHEHDGVLLQVVADPRDVRGDFHLIGEADSRDLPERGIRLLRGHGADDRADATLLGRAAAQLDVAAFERVPRRAEGGRVYFLALRLASFAYELRDRWHRYSFYRWSRARTGTPLTGSSVQALTRDTAEPPLAWTVVERSAAPVTTSRESRCAK